MGDPGARASTSASMYHLGGPPYAAYPTTRAHPTASTSTSPTMDGAVVPPGAYGPGNHLPQEPGGMRYPQTSPRPTREGHPGGHHSGPSTTPPSSATTTGGSVLEFIDQPIYFETGQFKGHTVRAALEEIQKANLGRKYARVDRRPLDPPPVVLLRLYHTINGIEREIPNYDEVEMLGLVCTLDLLPVPPNCYTYGEDSPSGSPSYTDYHGSSSSSVAAPVVHHANPSVADVVHHVNGFPVYESSKCTNALVGQTFIQPNLVEYKGKKAIVFVFADLAVKIEGNFILRYRFFDLYARPRIRPMDRVVIQAECYGGPFHVFSTKEFPGLQASTELTKHLARWGVRLNIRETERRKKVKVKEDVGPYTTTVLKRKRDLATSAVSDDSDDEVL